MCIRDSPEVTLARESMFDAAEAVVAPTLQSQPIPPPPMTRRRGSNAAPEMRANGTVAPADPFRAPAWTTTDGRLSDTRWPYLAALNWLLPMSAEGEALLAQGHMMEGYWNLGYRGLIPQRLAKVLTPHPAQENNAATLNADRRVLRRLEQHRRKALTQAILPEWSQEDSLRLDLFGDPLSSSDSQEPRSREPP